MALDRITKENFIQPGPKFRVYHTWYNLLVDAINNASTTLEQATTGITAFATGGQASATQLSTYYNDVTVCATAGDSVKLPTAALSTVCIVKNNGAASLNVFPYTGDCINALAANLAVAVPVGAEVKFVAISATTWESNSETLVLSSPSTQKGELVIRAANSAGETATVITNASQAAARTYTIPDAGANASFVMSAGATTLLASATTTPLTIDGTTTDHTNTTPMISIDVDDVGSAINVVNINLDVTTTALTADTVNGVNIDLDGLAADADTSLLNGITVTLTAPSTSRADTSGLVVGIDSVRDTADTDNGLVVGFTGTMSNASADSYGVRVTTAGFTHTNGVFHGLYCTVPTAVTAGTAYGGHIVVDSTALSNPKYGLYITKNLVNNAASGALSQTNSALSIAQISSSLTAASGATTVSNTAVQFNVTNSAALATADVWGGTVLNLTYSATTTGAGTATNVATGLFIDYDITETAGTLSDTAFNVAYIDFDTTGTPAFANGTYNLLLIDADTASSIDAAATVTLNGIKVDLSGTVVTDGDLTLYGLNVVMPTLGTSPMAAITTNGRIVTTSAPAGLNSSTISIGTYATPVVDANASDAFALTINMSTAVNKTGAGDSCMGAYVRISNTADGANTRLQGVLASTGVAFDCYDAYGLQSNMSISAGAVATGNLTAVSGKVTVADAVATGIISAGLFTLEGAFNPAALTYGVWIDITAGITADSGLIINNNASTCVNGIKLSGTFTQDIALSGTVNVYSGVAVTRAAVRAIVGDTAPQGSLFIAQASVATTKPNMYIKVLNAGNDSDWERIVTQASD